VEALKDDKNASGVLRRNANTIVPYGKLPLLPLARDGKVHPRRRCHQ
jgi:hypothetical protein